MVQTVGIAVLYVLHNDINGTVEIVAFSVCGFAMLKRYFGGDG